MNDGMLAIVMKKVSSGEAMKVEKGRLIRSLSFSVAELALAASHP